MWRPIAVAALAVALVAPSCDSGRKADPDWRTSAVEGGFLLGANYWNRYGGDFGSNAWGEFGVAQESRQVGKDLDAMRRAGVSVVRWPVFADGRAGIDWAQDGTPEGVQEGVWRDMGAALDMLGKRRMCALFVLFDFTMTYKSELVDGVAIGGHADAWRDPAKRSQLVDRVVAPMVGRLARSDQILGWDLMNEPEWFVEGLPHALPDAKAQTVSPGAFWDGAARMSEAVHGAGRQLVTLGSAAPRWAGLWTDGWALAEGLPPLRLDVYQVHYHPATEAAAGPEGASSPVARTVGALGLDRPVLVGEIPVGRAGELRAVRQGGWAGALAWRYKPGDDATDWGEVRRWSGGERPCP